MMQSESGEHPKFINILQYLLYGVAGFAFLLPPNSGLKDLLGDGGFLLWNGLLILGGIFGIVGSALRMRRIELIGVPGVVAGLSVYSVFIMSQLPDSQVPGVLIGFATICAGSAVGGLGRGIEILYTTRTVDKVVKRIESEGQSDEGLGE